MPDRLQVTEVEGPLRATVVALSDRGMKRKRNEDFLLCHVPKDKGALLSKGFVCVVADGMGGHEAGDVASKLAAETVIDAYFGKISATATGKLVESIEAANFAVCEHARDEERGVTMGTTVVAASLKGSSIKIANVGDSRGFLVRDGQVEQITEDHSWVMEQLRDGHLSEEEIRSHPRRNLITRALGIEEHVKTDVFERTLQAGDTLILCSDGMWGHFEMDEIGNIVADSSPEQAVETLVEQSNARGGEDNISVILIRIHEFEPTETVWEKVIHPTSDGKIRVLRIIARLNVGGPAIHTTLLTKYMQDRGYDTRLVSGVEEQREGNMLYIAEEKGVEPVIIEEMSREIRPRRDWIAYQKICKQIEEFRPHILHTHTSKAGALGRLAARKYQVPVVVHTYHGHVLTGEFGPIRSRIFRHVEKYLSKFTDRLIFISSTGKDELVSLGVAPPEKFAVVYLGLELEKFRHAKKKRGKIREEIGLTEDDFLVGMVARLAGIKNHQEYFDAIKQISPDHPDIHFAVIGDGPAHDDLVKYAKSLGVESKVHFLGMRSDMVQVHADLDLCVLTSRNEGLPVAFLEALSSGTPVVGSDVGATRELRNLRWPVGVYPPGHVEDFVVSILDVHEMREYYANVGRECKDQVIRRFSINRLVDDLDRLYQELLREKSVIT